MIKYKEYFKRMVKTYKELFDKFAKIHTDYGMDNDKQSLAGGTSKYQEEFNDILPALKSGVSLQRRMTYQRSIHLRNELRSVLECCYKVGADVLKVIHEWEGRLCSHSEKAGYANYTGNLAEKFQQEVKNHFPLIDHIGIIVKKSLPIKSGFSLKKISL